MSRNSVNQGRGQGVMLFVSELAGAIGRNKYKPVPQATVEIWRRVSRKSYDAALKRRQAEDWADDEAVVSRLNLNLDDAVHVACESKATETVKQLMQRPLAPATDDAVKTVQNILERADLLPVQKETMLVQQVMKRSGPKVSAIVLQKMTRQITTLAAPDQETTEQEITALLNLPKVGDCERTARCVQSAVNKRRGTKNEDKGIKAYEQKTQQQTYGHNSKFYKANIGVPGQPCWIGGRVDGLTDTKVIEVKCRRNRLFRWLPAYERVQLACYMSLTNRKECDLVQRHGDQTSTTTYQFDPGYWDEVCDEIRAFQRDLYAVLTDHDAQDDLLDEVE